MTPQRPYKVSATNTARALKFRHSSVKIDATMSRERIVRPFGATPRTAQDWR